MDILHDALRGVMLLGMLAAPLAAGLFGWRAGVGVAGGITWAVANVWVLAKLVTTMVGASKRPWWQGAWWWVLKLPVLYGIGAVLLVSSWSSPIGFLVGFSLWFVAVVACAVRRAVA